MVRRPEQVFDKCHCRRAVLLQASSHHWTRHLTASASIWRTRGNITRGSNEVGANDASTSSAGGRSNIDGTEIWPTGSMPPCMVSLNLLWSFLAPVSPSSISAEPSCVPHWSLEGRPRLRRPKRRALLPDGGYSWGVSEAIHGAC